MKFFGANKIPQPTWTCSNCNEPEDTRVYSLGKPDKDDPTRCFSCVFYEKQRDRKRRKRQEELAALIAGRLAPNMPALRDNSTGHELVAAEAFRIAESIMNLSGNGRDYLDD